MLTLLRVQVDSGYSTTSAGAASLTDSESHCKEPFTSNLLEEAFQVPPLLKVTPPHLSTVTGVPRNVCPV